MKIVQMFSTSFVIGLICLGVSCASSKSKTVTTIAIDPAVGASSKSIKPGEGGVLSDTQPAVRTKSKTSVPKVGPIFRNERGWM
jgi:hypothetical protein